MQLRLPDLPRREDSSAADAHAPRRGAARRRGHSALGERPSRSLHAMRELRGGLPGGDPASSSLRRDAAGLRRRGRRRPRAPPRDPRGGARLDALHPRLPARAARRLHQADAGVPPGRDALPRPARRERRGARGDVHPLRRVRPRVPHAGEPRAGGRGPAMDRVRPRPLHRMRDVRRGVPGEPGERRPDAPRARGADERLVRGARRVRGGPGAVSVAIERVASAIRPSALGRRDDGEPLRDRIALWEDLLTLVVDPHSPRVPERDRKRALIGFLLARAGVDEAAFWRLPRGRRAREFLGRYSRASRAIARLGITSFDLDKVLKERFRHEPLTLGAAWHYGLWRSYFSHAAITHPANDGLREEFSTAWDLVRKEPAVLFREAGGMRTTPLTSVRLDMPILVGPIPFGDGVTLETAYPRAVRAVDPEHDLRTRTLVVVRAADVLAHAPALLPYAADI